ncbi:hypothetical protein [uncultured Methanomethylovorans sp.]|uniref:hypothetical protein n=1 Tax=uncultured Methanomethylovorans sp. TaxID=183759 RepID=UPI002AA607E8|nr:hypothetical protein [uncultured Methanomethylovorans sp.]
MTRKKNQIHRICVVFMILSVSAFVACGSSAAAEDANRTLENEVTSQIPDQVDKSNMTEAESKLSTDLLDLVKATKSVATNGAVVNSDSEDLVYVYINLYKGNSTNVIEPIVKEITDRDEDNSVAVAWVSVNKLEELASLKEVKNIRTVAAPVVNNSSATTEENNSMNKTQPEKTPGFGFGLAVFIIGLFALGHRCLGRK